jgi:hypothetical protein
MAGSLSINEQGYRPGLVCLSLDWEADSAGQVEQETALVEGTVERLTFVPSQISGQVPDDAYSAELLDQDQVDVLGALGASLSNSAASDHLPTDADAVLPRATAGTLTLAISGAGAGGAGTIRLYVRR